jgi:hypothetical protein
LLSEVVSSFVPSDVEDGSPQEVMVNTTTLILKMVEDFLTDKHGVVTGLLAMRNAPGANFYGYRLVKWSSGS